MINDSLKLNSLSSKDSIILLRGALATKYYNYFSQNQPSLTSNKSIIKAFSYWNRNDDADNIRKVFKEIDVNDSLWSKLVRHYQMTYIMNGDLQPFLKELENIQSVVSNNSSKLFVFNELGRSMYMKYKETASQEYRKKALFYFNEIVKIQGNEFFIEQVKNVIYELTELDIGMVFPNFSVEDINNNKFQLIDTKSKL